MTSTKLRRKVVTTTRKVSDCQQCPHWEPQCGSEPSGCNKVPSKPYGYPTWTGNALGHGIPIWCPLPDA